MPPVKPPPVRKVTVAAPKPAAKPASKAAERETALNGVGQIGQTVLMAAGQHADAGTVGMHWPGVAREVAVLAESQPQVAGIIDVIIKTGPYTALIAAILPLAMQIAVNHKLMPAGVMGTVPAELIDARVKSEIARLQASALEEQRIAEAELARLREELPGQKNS